MCSFIVGDENQLICFLNNKTKIVIFLFFVMMSSLSCCTVTVIVLQTYSCTRFSNFSFWVKHFQGYSVQKANIVIMFDIKYLFSLKKHKVYNELNKQTAKRIVLTD